MIYKSFIISMDVCVCRPSEAAVHWEKAQYEDQVVGTWASLYIMVFCETSIYVITGGLLGRLLELKSGRVLLGTRMFIMLEYVWVCTGVSICTCIWLHLSMCLHTCACMCLWSFV